MPTKAKAMPDDQTVAGVKQIIANIRRKKKGSELARRRRIEAISRYESWLPELERKEAAERYEARQQQFQENAQRLRTETRQAPKQGQPPVEVEKNLAQTAERTSVSTQARDWKRPVFYFRNSDEYYFRGAYDALVPAKIKKLSNGDYVDAEDNEPVRVVETFPQPTRGAVLLDNGDWRLPEVKHPVIAPPPRIERIPGANIPYPNREAAERTARKVQRLGYQATIGSADNRVYVLYDEKWIGLAEWKAKMGVEL
jgi:hypothetical protein